MRDTVDYFQLFGPPELAENQPADDELIAWAQRELGVRLPDAYKQMVKVRNGGYLFCEGIIPTEQQFEWHGHRKVYSVREIQGIEKEGTSNIVLSTSLARDEWDGPEGLVAFTGEGHWWLCLDYRDCGPNGEPTIVHCENDSETPSGQNEWFQVAPSFDALIRGLGIDHDGDYLLGVSDLSRDEIKKRVESLPTKPDPFAHENFHALLFTEYDGQYDRQKASIKTGEPNLEFESTISIQHRRFLLGLNDDEIDIPASVSFEHAAELIPRILDALGQSARVVHCPMDGPQINQR